HKFSFISLCSSWKSAVAAMIWPSPFLQNFILCFIFIPLCCSQSTFPQNIETSYPFPSTFHVPLTNNTSDNLSTISWRPSPPPPSHLPPQEAVQLQLKPKHMSKKATIITVAISIAAATLMLSLCLFFYIRRCILAEHKEEQDDRTSQSREGQALVSRKEFTRFNGNFNGFILEENGLDVIYWKNPAGRKSKKNEDEELGFVKEGGRKPQRVQETPLLMSSTKIEARDYSLSSSQKLPWLPPPPPAPPRKPPPAPPPKAVANSGSSSAGNDQTRLKPLHWDKVNTNVDHAMVWDKIDGGSFRFNGDLMEALFGYVATNKKSPPKQSGNHEQTKSSSPNNGGQVQISILDSRRSRNIAIILKSLNISRQELLDALMEGQGLDSDTLEKLVKITPNQEQQSQILEFDGDPLKLADAESFIFHLLKAVPTAFTRLNAMLFRSNFKSAIIRLRDFSQTLGVGCEELKKKGLFTKLLEATLKAGNRLNSGTTRGGAEAFNLESLLKLSDVKSTDGKTTLFHFVVEEVMKSEGKKRFLNKNSKTPILEKERENEYTILGLSAIESLTSELSNVKKASTIDYEAFIASCPNLLIQISGIRKLLSKEGGEYKRKMMSFVKSAEEELETARREQKRVLEIVKKTNEYFETGDRENPLELFVIVRDFVNMLNQVGSEIGGNLKGKSKMEILDGFAPLKSSLSLSFPCMAECRSFSSDFTDDSF
ncbi:formin-like protein 4, partial [Benincasa hispida]|uniref:formin-like protein 4 n=1 Tax=Benincasa hispida TaxID=102211 RepID=UPI0018FF936B